MSYVERSCRKKNYSDRGRYRCFNATICNIFRCNFSVPHIILCHPAVIVSGVRLPLGGDVN